MITFEDVEKIFYDEFGIIAQKFETIRLQACDGKRSLKDYKPKPGVYVWWNSQKGPLKVGRHLSNVENRAWEHIRDDTGGIMKKMGSDPNTMLLLFRVRDPKNMHWAAAVEIFLEQHIRPKVRSKRLG